MKQDKYYIRRRWDGKVEVVFESKDYFNPKGNVWTPGTWIPSWIEAINSDGTT